MQSWMPQYRLLLPLLLTSTISFFLCAAMAVFLLREQSESAASFGETIASYRASSKLEESLIDLVALLNNKNEDVRALNERISGHLRDIESYANSKQEIEAIDELNESFTAYLTIWRTLPGRRGDDHTAARKEAIRVLESETLPTC